MSVIDREQLELMLEFQGEHHLPMYVARELGPIWRRDGLRAAWQYLDRMAEREKLIRGEEG